MAPGTGRGGATAADAGGARAHPGGRGTAGGGRGPVRRGDVGAAGRRRVDRVPPASHRREPGSVADLCARRTA